MKTIMNVIKRHFEKRRIKALVAQLPQKVQPEIMHGLLDILDLPNCEKRVGVRIILNSVKEAINADYEEKTATLRKTYTRRIEKAAGNVLAPGFPIPEMSINHDLIEEKAKAKLTIAALEEEALLIPHVGKPLLFVALMGLAFSLPAHFFAASTFLGDWLGGWESLSTASHVLVAVVAVILEAVALAAALNFLPKRYAYGLARLGGLIGALIVVVSLFMLVFARTEVGTTRVATPTQNVGEVE